MRKGSFLTSTSRFSDPNIKAVEKWINPNIHLYNNFRTWLREGGYGDVALWQYCTAAKLAFGLLDKPYWELDLDADFERVREYIASYYSSVGTQKTYRKGLAKFEQFLREVRNQTKPTKRINWAYFLDPLPDWLAAHVRAYIKHCQRNYLPQDRHKTTNTQLSHCTLFLRWAAQNAVLNDARDLTPDLWFDYVDMRLEAGRTPATLNGELHCLRGLLYFLRDLQVPVCERTLLVETLAERARIPRDIPLLHLRKLLEQIETDAAKSHGNPHRMGTMDRAWFLLMLHSGLRVGEVRRLRLSDMNLEARRLRIEQSKGLKDRLVCMTATTMQALNDYLDIRGAAETDHVFIFRHLPLSECYCSQRLKTYGSRCDVKATPHQLRHSCATLLLNAGAPILTVQALLGHKFLDTTLTYARLYDGTIANDYYKAMQSIEQDMQIVDAPDDQPVTVEYVLSLLDSLQDGQLSENQNKVLVKLQSIFRETNIPNTH